MLVVYAYVWLFGQENHFLDDIQDLSFSHKPKDIGAVSTLFPPSALMRPLLCCLSWL